ncbi:Nucleoside triphosphate pyrophosphohydrolase/pyrophosphatase MazG [subsurface metagenome]
MSLSQSLDQFATLVALIAKLRAPDGCPWDRKQTHTSLRENLLGECYEVLEALDEGDSGRLCAELGDLLMQIVLHAQLATEAGEFELGDVLSGINTKLIHRHPHIFGSRKVKDAEEVALNWEVLKQEEREADTSILASVPKQMPALGYGQEIQRRVVRVGFDWEDVDGVIDKLVEEVGELKRVDSQPRRAEEFGDLLFTLVNVARRLGVDLEAALREANKRFYRRFTYMEEVCRQRGLNLAEMSFDEQNALWEEAKKALQE